MAQPVPDLGPDLEPPSAEDLHALPDIDEDQGARAVGEAPEDRSVLDSLFAELATASSDEDATWIARKIQTAWLQSGSDTVDVLMRRAGEAMKAEKTALALDLLDRILVLQPDFAEAWNRRATVYYMQEEFGKSLADIERTLALETRHWGAMSGLAIIQRRLGQETQAQETFKRVLQIYPGLENARKALDELEAKNEGEPI
ncbi:hypothetical protein GCM10011316_00570 [Roseibium aquae]|uniref:Tetratricopeptide repeat protein n=1 Tax=Roseibium aquae TaxID=1323746 RepID=A0A916T5F4_9HYPH|nr:tetratricopeptide repeat protein [Roseibium aquae]GGB32361.1 hypothetical protein GCM10011316_00570 [Roseibium aquae]